MNTMEWLERVKKPIKKVRWWGRYVGAVTGLLLERNISLATWRYALSTYPVAVCGQQGAWVVDPNFEMKGS